MNIYLLPLFAILLLVSACQSNQGAEEYQYKTILPAVSKSIPIYEESIKGEFYPTDTAKKAKDGVSYAFPDTFERVEALHLQALGAGYTVLGMEQRMAVLSEEELNREKTPDEEELAELRASFGIENPDEELKLLNQEYQIIHFDSLGKFQKKVPIRHSFTYIPTPLNAEKYIAYSEEKKAIALINFATGDLTQTPPYPISPLYIVRIDDTHFAALLPQYSLQEDTIKRLPSILYIFDENLKVVAAQKIIKEDDYRLAYIAANETTIACAVMGKSSDALIVFSAKDCRELWRVDIPHKRAADGRKSTIIDSDNSVAICPSNGHIALLTLRRISFPSAIDWQPFLSIYSAEGKLLREKNLILLCSSISDIQPYADGSWLITGVSQFYNTKTLYHISAELEYLGSKIIEDETAYSFNPANAHLLMFQNRLHILKNTK